MAELSDEVEKDQISLPSLYETCFKVLSSEFGLIQKKYIKDLPKHILEELLYRLNPFHLEILENEEFLDQRGIETDALWKDHFKRHFKYGAKVLNDYTCSTWREQYFKRNFHIILHTIAVKSKSNVEIDDLKNELFKQPSGSTISTASPLDMNDILHLCMRHLTGIQIRNNAACVYLSHHENILTKLSSVLEHIEVVQLRDHSVEALIHILDVLLNNKLKSFSLSDCKVENEVKIRVLLKTLAKSQFLSNAKCLTQRKLSAEDASMILNECVTCNERDNFTEEETGVKSEDKFGENVKEHLNRDKLETIDNKDFGSCTFRADSFHPGAISENDNRPNELGVHPEKYAILCVTESHDNLSRVHGSNQEKCSDVNNVEDDLYEDIFSRHGELQEACINQEGDPVSTRISEPSSEIIRNPWWKERTPESCYNPIHLHCLTELKLSSCLNNNASLKVFSEELVHFPKLRSLSLCDVGLCSFPAMNDLTTTIKELVIHGSLRYLVFENQSLGLPQINMFYRMLILSCERCQLTNSHEGLWSLRLVASVDFNMDKLGTILRTCSFCEEEVLAHRSDAGIWFKTKDNTFYPACSCLNKGVSKCRNTSECRSTNVGCNFEELPVICKQHDGDFQVTGYNTNIQANSFRSSLVEKTDIIGSKHEYICTGIESLYLGFHNMRHQSATVLANSLLRNRSLRSISLPSCGLDTDDINSIFNCIAGNDFHEVNTAIEKLNLRENVFQVIENNSLCSLLTTSHLVYLDLSYCGLEVVPDDVVLALSSNKFLQVFMIAGNRLGNAGVIQLSKVFASSKKTSVLNTFDLSCNRLSSSSLLHFANVLSTWPTKLRAISVGENPLVESEIARECLEKVFDVVLVEHFIDSAMVYADYLSEM